MRILAVDVDEHLREGLALVLSASSVEELSVEDLPEGDRLAAACDCLVLPAPVAAHFAPSLRRREATRRLLIAAYGNDPEAGCAALDAGADVCLDQNEPPELLAARLRALGRRAGHGSTSPIASLAGLLPELLFRNLLRHEFERSKRYRRAVTVMAIESDAAQDASEDSADNQDALTDRLRGTVRDVDLLTRSPKGRFLMALPETDAGGAVTAAGRILGAATAISDGSAGTKDGARGGTTLSIGVAAFPSRGMESAEALLGRALESLAHAQNRGGGLIVTFGAADIVWSRDAPDPDDF